MTAGAICGTVQRLLPDPDVIVPNKLDILLVGDGYLAGELPSFHSHCSGIVSAIKLQPWYSSNLGLRIYMLDVCSDNSLLSAVPGSVATFFSSSLVNGQLSAPDSAAIKMVNDVAIQSHPEISVLELVAVLVNTSSYGGGSDGKVLCASSGDIHFRSLFLHEFGHQCYLFEEYGYRGFCAENNPSYLSWDASYPEPPWPNVSGSRTLPDWAGDFTSDPPITKDYAGDGSECDDRDFPGISPATVGVFEGSGRFRKGLYRPSPRCKMRKLQHGFCPVCQAQIKMWLT